MSLIAVFAFLCVAVVGTSHATDDRCQMQVDSGYKCSGRKVPGLRFYYDAETDKCAKFFFLGCGGNSNRFLSRKRCRNHCSAACFDEDQKNWVPNGEKKTSSCGQCVCDNGVFACPASYSTCTLREKCYDILCLDECPSGLYYTDENGCDTCNCVPLEELED